MGGTLIAEALPARAGARSIHRRLARAALLLLVLAVVALCGGTLFPSPAAAALDDSITATLRSSGFGGSGTGVYIWDLDAARPVYELNPSAQLTPASNLKLMTSAAAILNWGTSHRFSTELYLPDTALSRKGVLNGNVYLRGLGDPSLSTRSYQREEFDMTTASFEAFAHAVKKAGVKRIRGGVIGDASWFDKLETVPTWKDGLQLECGRLSALSGNQGLQDGNRMKAPAEFAAGLMTRALVAAGVKVERKPAAGTIPPTARRLTVQRSATLRTLLKRLNKDSDNFFAEMLVKGLGKELYDKGSTAAGTDAVEVSLHALGVKNGSYVIEDGSGLSYGNRLTALGLVRLLGAMRQREDFDDFYDSLAVGGEDGTLRERMEGTAAAGNVHAKTGSLDIAASLSGYVTSANGHLVAFAILINGGEVDWQEAADAQDDIVVALARATLPGDPVLAATPVLRQHSVSAIEAVHGVGCRLKPGVQP